MEKNPTRRIAFIIALENYNVGPKKINPVKYAINDATRFKKILIDYLSFKEEDIYIYSNHSASKETFENDLSYHINSLTPTDQFIFYYAGHGFYSNGENRLTCWETNPENLFGTSVSFKEVLLEKLDKSGCTSALIFLDCCSVRLSSKYQSRQIFAAFDTRKVDELMETGGYRAIFMSCSTGEKSYSSDTLQSGVWTWHLCMAISGVETDAIIDHAITDNSLKRYLVNAVPNFVKKEIGKNIYQTPYTTITSSGDYIIRRVPNRYAVLSNTFRRLPIIRQKIKFIFTFIGSAIIAISIFLLLRNNSKTISDGKLPDLQSYDGKLTTYQTFSKTQWGKINFGYTPDSIYTPATDSYTLPYSLYFEDNSNGKIINFESEYTLPAISNYLKSHNYPKSTYNEFKKYEITVYLTNSGEGKAYDIQAKLFMRQPRSKYWIPLTKEVHPFDLGPKGYGGGPFSVSVPITQHLPDTCYFLQFISYYTDKNKTDQKSDTLGVIYYYRKNGWFIDKNTKIWSFTNPQDL